jgi:hypothetical protein
VTLTPFAVIPRERSLLCHPERAERVEGSALGSSTIAAPEVHVEHAEAAEERHAENGLGIEIAAPAHGSSPATTTII